GQRLALPDARPRARIKTPELTVATDAVEVVFLDHRGRRERMRFFATLLFPRPKQRIVAPFGEIEPPARVRAISSRRSHGQEQLEATRVPRGRGARGRGR